MDFSEKLLCQRVAGVVFADFISLISVSEETFGIHGNLFQIKNIPFSKAASDREPHLSDCSEMCHTQKMLGINEIN